MQLSVGLRSITELRRATKRLRTHARTFSFSPELRSHIGRQVIECPSTVKIGLEPLQSPSPFISNCVVVSGPQGEVRLPLMTFVEVTQHMQPSSTASLSENSQLVVKVADSSIQKQRAVWGLSRSLIANAVRGVSEGYNVPVRLVGVGYRAVLEDVDQKSRLATGTVAIAPGTKQRLNMKLGFAHPVLIDVPHDLRVSVPSTTNIVISGVDKQKIGEFAARIRRWRKPEPYNVSFILR
jgi:large subunit ribosomal protein L6